MIRHVIYSNTLNFLIHNIKFDMTTKHNNSNNEDYSLVTPDVSYDISDKDLLAVFKALESAGFRFIDHYEN
jgi:hypothetical protein